MDCINPIQPVISVPRNDNTEEEVSLNALPQKSIKIGKDDIFYRELNAGKSSFVIFRQEDAYDIIKKVKDDDVKETTSMFVSILDRLSCTVARLSFGLACIGFFTLPARQEEPALNIIAMVIGVIGWSLSYLIPNKEKEVEPLIKAFMSRKGDA